MTAVRIIAPTDDAEFPYDAAIHLLDSLPGCVREEADLPAIIAAGKRVGWPQTVIDEHFDYMKNGKCFDFTTGSGLVGTLWEDNIFFRFHDAAHQEHCMPLIGELAARLSCRIFHQ